MIKKIRSSLFAKVFIVISILLICMGFLVYGLLAWIMPQSYSDKLNAELEEQTQSFISELEKASMESGKELVAQFQQNESVGYVELYTEDGQLISVHDGTEDIGGYAFETASSTSEISQVLPNSYYFSFADSNDRYTLFVYGEAAKIAELQSSFIKIIPLLVCIVLAVGFLVSFLVSRIITNPVLKISRISKAMTELQLGWSLTENRTDELGILEKSLNILSRNLDRTITDLQNANKQLAGDIEREKKMEQARLSFFSAVSHELKTPITVIKGQLEGMLLNVGAYKNHEKYLARSLEVANTLETMVQEILTVSRLETATVHFATERFDCVPVIRDYLAKAEDFIIRKDLQIHDEMPPCVFIDGNKILMEKVFSNIIGNAIKYTSQGAAIRISVSQEQGKHIFSVENSGTHIPEESLPKLFDEFYRIDQSRNKKSAGSGLGLYITKKILEQHGSSCAVCNTSTGVCFSFQM